ncbi:MAG: hypothetical protein ACOZIN_20135 [Myxococcota bacterium]
MSKLTRGWVVLVTLSLAACSASMSNDEDAGGGSGGGAGGGGAGGGGGGGGGADQDAGDVDGGNAQDGGSGSDAGAGYDGGWLGVDGGVSPTMSFFVTSRGNGRGGDLRTDAGDSDGLVGADALCHSLAQAVSPILGAKTWRAYLSTATIDARDRIGSGPWYNAKGVVIAQNVAHLHDDAGMPNALSLANTLDENGNEVRSVSPGNVHDILTGTNLDGTVYAGQHCNNWTSSTAAFTARVGHSNRQGGGQFPTSWNSAHNTAGCAPPGTGGGNVGSGGGRGSFYCFASN